MVLQTLVFFPVGFVSSDDKACPNEETVLAVRPVLQDSS